MLVNFEAKNKIKQKQKEYEKFNSSFHTLIICQNSINYLTEKQYLDMTKINILKLKIVIK